MSANIDIKGLREFPTHSWGRGGRYTAFNNRSILVTINKLHNKAIAFVFNFRSQRSPVTFSFVKFSVSWKSYNHQKLDLYISGLMTLQELQKQALQLPTSDRWQLVQTLLELLKRETHPKVTQEILFRLRGITKSSVAIDYMENSLTQKICNGVSQP